MKLGFLEGLARARGLGSGVLEWILRREALAAATRERSEHERRRPFVRRARAASRAGDALLDPPHADRAEPALAMRLFSDAAYWLLRANGPVSPPASRAELFELAGREPEAFGDVAREVPAALGDNDPGEFSQRPLEAQATAARAAQRWLAPHLEAAELSFMAGLRLRIERITRLCFAVSLVAGLVAGAWELVWIQRHPDLARGRPWRASSSYDTCDPAAHRCAGHTTDIFFHTQDDASPWLEIDLGAAKRFSRVEVKNRSDNFAERAVPLVIEVSQDGTNFFQVAQRRETFSLWKAKFSPQTARYVRLRITRKSFLHLERVSVRP